MIKSLVNYEGIMALFGSNDKNFLEYASERLKELTDQGKIIIRFFVLYSSN
jgi:hypothetical protein